MEEKQKQDESERLKEQEVILRLAEDVNINDMITIVQALRRIGDILGRDDLFYESNEELDEILKDMYFFHQQGIIPFDILITKTLQLFRMNLRPTVIETYGNIVKNMFEEICEREKYDLLQSYIDVFDAFRI